MSLSSTMTSLMDVSRNRFGLTQKLSVNDLEVLLQRLPQTLEGFDINEILKFNTNGTTLKRSDNCAEIYQDTTSSQEIRFLRPVNQPITGNNMLLFNARNSSNESNVKLLVGAYDARIEVEVDSKDFKTYVVQLKDSPSQATYLNFILQDNAAGHLLDIKRIALFKLGGVAKALLCAMCAMLPVRGCAA